MNRRRGDDREFLQALPVRLADFRRVSIQGHRVTQQLGHPLREAFQERVSHIDIPLMRHRRRHRIPGSAILFRQLGISRYASAEFLFRARLVGNQRSLDQGELPALDGFQRIFNLEEQSLRRARLLRPLRGEFAQHAAQFGKQVQNVGLRRIALEFELRQRIVALGRTGVAARECDIALFDALGREF